eukprot:8353106-Alexandrium_andersonii.AAC.1
MGDICHVAPFSGFRKLLDSEEPMPEAGAVVSEAVGSQTSPFLLFDAHSSNRRGARGRVGAPGWGTLLVFGAR